MVIIYSKHKCHQFQAKQKAVQATSISLNNIIIFIIITLFFSSIQQKQRKESQAVYIYICESSPRWKRSSEKKLAIQRSTVQC